MPVLVPDPMSSLHRRAQKDEEDADFLKLGSGQLF